MGKECQILWNIRDIPPLRWQVLYFSVPNPNFAFLGFMESHNGFKNQSLSTPCRAKEEVKSLLLNFNIQLLDPKGFKKDGEPLHFNHKDVFLPPNGHRIGYPDQKPLR